MSVKEATIFEVWPGFTADEAGNVLEVDEGSEVAMIGVTAGWRVRRVNGSRLTDLWSQMGEHRPCQVRFTAPGVADEDESEAESSSDSEGDNAVVQSTDSVAAMATMLAGSTHELTPIVPSTGRAAAIARQATADGSGTAAGSSDEHDTSDHDAARVHESAHLAGISGEANPRVVFTVAGDKCRILQFDAVVNDGGGAHEQPVRVFVHIGSAQHSPKWWKDLDELSRLNFNHAVSRIHKDYGSVPERWQTFLGLHLPAQSIVCTIMFSTASVSVLAAADRLGQQRLFFDVASCLAAAYERRRVPLGLKLQTQSDVPTYVLGAPHAFVSVEEDGMFTLDEHICSILTEDLLVYCPPEVVIGWKQITTVDAGPFRFSASKHLTWVLGTLAYECASGALPWRDYVGLVTPSTDVSAMIPPLGASQMADEYAQMAMLMLTPDVDSRMEYEFLCELLPIQARRAVDGFPRLIEQHGGADVFLELEAEAEAVAAAAGDMLDDVAMERADDFAAGPLALPPSAPIRELERDVARRFSAADEALDLEEEESEMSKSPEIEGPAELPPSVVYDVFDEDFEPEGNSSTLRSIPLMRSAAIAETEDLWSWHQPERVDDVLFSAYGAETVSRGATFPLTIWAYLRQQAQEVRERARAEGTTARGSLVRALQVGLRRLVTITLEAPKDMKVNGQSSATFVWLGSIERSTFYLSVERHAAIGVHMCRARIVCGAAVADLTCYITVSDSSVTASGGPAFGAADWEAVRLRTELVLLQNALKVYSPSEISASATAVGSGNFGSAFLARVPDHSSQVVLKSLRSTIDMSSLIHELSLHALVSQHPNVVRIYGACLEGSAPGMVMEYMERGSLDMLLYSGKAHKRLSVALDTKVRWACDAAAGLAQVHSAKLVHRDVAARNILVSGAGVAKLADFGLSQLSSATGVGAAADGYGPIQHSAPESLMAPHVYSAQSDAFMFGTTLWEIIEQEYPFEGCSVTDAAMRIVRGEALPFTSDHWEYPLNEVVSQLRSTEPNERWQMERVYTILHELLQ